MIVPMKKKHEDQNAGVCTSLKQGVHNSSLRKPWITTKLLQTNINEHRACEWFLLEKKKNFLNYQIVFWKLKNRRHSIIGSMHSALGKSVCQSTRMYNEITPVHSLAIYKRNHFHAGAQQCHTSFLSWLTNSVPSWGVLDHLSKMNPSTFLLSLQIVSAYN